MVDFLDPNNWPQIFLPHEHHIYADNSASRWAVVDEEDYQFAVRHKWHINKPHPTRNGKKEYFCRSTSNGTRGGPKLYLHVEIMKRTGILPPSGLHTMVDHRDGNEWNCRRGNLYWATPRQNRLNLFGVMTNGSETRYVE